LPRLMGRCPSPTRPARAVHADRLQRNPALKAEDTCCGYPLRRTLPRPSQLPAVPASPAPGGSGPSAAGSPPALTTGLGLARRLPELR
jgi:hypothetical protein